MFYSAIGLLAMLILLIENYDILLKKGGFELPSWKVYRRFLFAVLVYYVTDIIWGLLEAEKLSALLFADTSVYFVAMAAGVLFWTQYLVTYLGEKKIYGQILLYTGRVFAVLVTVLVGVNIFLPVLFTVDEACVYRALATRYAVLGSQILLLLTISGFAFTAIIRRSHEPGKRNRHRTLGLFGVIMATFLSAQLWFPYLPLYAIAYLLGTCLLRAVVIRDEKEEYRRQLLEAEKAAEQKQIEEERLVYNRILVLSDDFLCVIVVEPESEDYYLFSTNDAFESFGLPREGTDFFNATREFSKNLVWPDDLDRFMTLFTKEEVLEEIGRSGFFSLSYRLKVNGAPRYIRLKIAREEEAEGEHLIVGIDDIDAHVRQEAEYEKRLVKAQNQAKIDALTGVKNKFAYNEAEKELNRKIMDGQAPAFTVAILDLNDLKKVNDTLGHQAGDQALRDASRIICQTFKHSPVFRVGGDEFVVISQGHDCEHAEELTAGIAAHNAQALRDGGAVVACGIAEFREGDGNVAAVFERADAKMYEDKNALKAAAELL